MNYYPCGTCGHVWNVSKVHPEAPPASSPFRNDADVAQLRPLQRPAAL